MSSRSGRSNRRASMTSAASQASAISVRPHAINRRNRSSSSHSGEGGERRPGTGVDAPCPKLCCVPSRSHPSPKRRTMCPRGLTRASCFTTAAASRASPEPTTSATCLCAARPADNARSRGAFTRNPAVFNTPVATLRTPSPFADTSINAGPGPGRSIPAAICDAIPSRSTILRCTMCLMVLQDQGRDAASPAVGRPPA